MNTERHGRTQKISQRQGGSVPGSALASSVPCVYDAVYAPTRMQRQGAWLHYAKGTDICLLLDDVCALCSGSKTGKAEWAGPCEPPGDKPVFLRGGRGNRSQTVCRPVRPLSRPER